uniref:NLE domain-containing protein n=1 Tax=Panagrolaimus sp. JU765 TaxID=591449 RepID=A0AC34QV80_9BILA
MVDIQNDPHFQVKFLAKDLKDCSLPEGYISIPSSATARNLNDLINSAAEQAIDDWKQVSFDFLIGGILFRGNLADFVVDNNIPQESVIEIECIFRQPPPEPDQDIPHEDWVSGVKVTTDRIFSITYGGELSAFSHDGKTLGTNDLVSQPLKCLDVFTLDGDCCVVVGCQDQTLTLSRVEQSGKKVNFVPLQNFRGHERSVECVAAKKDGTRIVSGGFDSLLKVWTTESNTRTEFSKSNTESGKRRKTDIATKTPMVTLQSHRDAIVDVEWHPLQPKQVVTASMDFNIIAWDLELAGFVTRLHAARAFTSISMNPENGLIISGSTDNKVRLWDLNSQEGSLVKETYHGHNGWVTDVHWSPKNTNQFVSGGLDQTVKMWDIRSPKAPLYDITGHRERVLTVDWSFQGLIASGSADSTLKTFKTQ